MSQKRFSPEYVKHLQQGPFVGRIDPWAEHGHFFHQIHGGMITYLQDYLQDGLNILGYQAGKEASLQIFANRKPDIYIQNKIPERPASIDWDYNAAASAINLETGTSVLDQDAELDLDAIHIRTMDTGQLVTVIEIISPRNKTHRQDILRYKEQREQVFLKQMVNVVEIDATRSKQRLLVHELTRDYPYHTAIYLPGEMPRILENRFEEILKPFALPLRGEVLRVEPQQAYNRAYQRGIIAGLIMDEGRYSLSELPFPSTLTDAQKETALQAITDWQKELKKLRENKP